MMRALRTSVAIVLSCLGGCARGDGVAGRAAAPPKAVHLHTVATAPMPRTIAVTGVLAAQE
jgi:hypothetical protein